MIGGAVVVGRGVGGMSLDVVAGSRAAIDEGSHGSLVGFGVRLASPEDYVKCWVRDSPSGRGKRRAVWGGDRCISDDDAGSGLPPSSKEAASVGGLIVFGELKELRSALMRRWEHLIAIFASSPILVT